MANRVLRDQPARWRGFTLLEGLIVLVLLGLLIAIALPSYGRYRSRALTSHALADIGAMSALVQVWADNNRVYPPDLAAAGLAGKLDPWGEPYVYYNVEENGRGEARKDRALNPINADFDLYSKGPDRVTQKQITNRDSVDDIIRASSGKFIGVAADF